MIELGIVDTEQRVRPPVGAIILAAGGSSRMGEPKQLLTIAGQPMVRRVAEVVCSAGLNQVVVVVGAHANAVEEALGSLAVQTVHNRAWAEGMSSSLRTGLDALQQDIQAALIVLADQPGLTAGLVQELVLRYQATRAPIVAPFYQGRRGNPVLFDRALFADLQRVEGDQGGRGLLDRYQDRLQRVEVEDPAVLLDVDTRQDYRTLDIEET
ncbi:MAG: nucleotidyltransferase family protein [Anaerolineae bacterium]|nr:nucleotidyltransferase family protein [Anaerolineae bacterium]